MIIGGKFIFTSLNSKNKNINNMNFFLKYFLPYSVFRFKND